MDYTLSNGYALDAGTGFRKHLQAQAIPTAVSDLDINQLNWELMAIVTAGGQVGAQFDPAVPATYTKVLAALRAAGVFCPVLQLNSTQVLPTTAFGSTVQAYGTGPFTLTLPATAGILPRTKIEFANYCGAGLVTIASSSANISWNGVAASVASFTLGLGDTATLMWTGTSWLVMGGTAQLGYSAAFASSLGATGWKRYPDANSPTGYILKQWGVSGSVPAGGSVSVTFPFTYANQILTVSAVAAGLANNATASGIGVQRSSSGLTLYNWGGLAYGAGIYWNVEGY